MIIAMWRNALPAISSALVLGSSLVTAAETAEPTARALPVKLSNYRVLPSATSIPAGQVTFVVHNADNVPHNLVVLRTRIPARGLPVSGAHGRAREVGRQGGTPFFYAEQTRRVTLGLAPGRYLLICNVPGHYQRGMVAVLRLRR